jgi:predicted peptidase
MKISFSYMLILALLVSGSLAGQETLFSYESFISSKGDTLNYRRLVSDYDTTAQYPLVVFLHGAGECGDDNRAQLKWAVQSFASKRVMKNYRPVVIAPQLPCSEDWDNLDFQALASRSEPSRYMKVVRELIDATIAAVPIDNQRIYITGVSMGGFGTFDAMLRYPDLFAAALPVCGAWDPSDAKEIAHIPLWIVQGANDPLIDPKWGHAMLTALTDLGSNPGFTQYPETGHFVWLAAYDDEMIIDWLFRQRKP